MGHKLNIRVGSGWVNILTDSNIDITDTNGYFSSTTLDGVLDELHNSGGSGGGLTWDTTTTNITASNSEGWFVDTSSNPLTLTLPSSPNIGDRVDVSDYTGSFQTNNCTINRNGSNIMGLSENFICDINNLGLSLVYSGTSQGWKVVLTADGGPDGSSSSSSSGNPKVITGAYKTGGVYGGNLVRVSNTTFNVEAISTTADDDDTLLYIDATTLVDLGTPTINTIYNVFICKNTDSSYSIETDTDVDGITLPASVVKKRWIGFVLTDSSGVIRLFTQNGDTLTFRYNTAAVVTSSLTSSYVNYPITSILPITRIISYTIRSWVYGIQVWVSYDGLNDEFYGGNNVGWAVNVLSNEQLYMKYNNSNGDVRVNSVRLYR